MRDLLRMRVEKWFERLRLVPKSDYIIYCGYAWQYFLDSTNRSGPDYHCEDIVMKYGQGKGELLQGQRYEHIQQVLTPFFKCLHGG